ncbi:hypothetical protein GCM10022198_16540 [Klugiella xanthotipulae]|uniref:Uncharacterized protein n=1 Tax=Klugiella xanthotipulae TaxID=244735 RepID=A0A543HH92_9MICO|nr:hypothetical protein [Klugiella xanthotipulae]TQM57690.1 hypothetical protein FB466_2686 [Klugiella xanthotipulae]
MSFSDFGVRPAHPDEQNPDDDTIWGWDATDTVGVGLSINEELRELKISPDWRKKLSTDELGPAVMTAYMGAIGARVRAGATQTSPVRAAGTSVTNDGQIPVIDNYLLDAVSRERDHYFTMYETELQTEHSYESADGNVTITARGGSPSTVTFDSFWLSFANASDIAETARGPLAQAMSSGHGIDEKIRDEFPAIAEFRRLRAIKKALRGW